ncbi:hypothetical protein [Sutcliffiella cohnii]|nr:hypothetical protein [Sutcliffiella cohnii]
MDGAAAICINENNQLWKSIEEIEQLELSFPEDKQFYLQQLKGKNS